MGSRHSCIQSDEKKEAARVREKLTRLFSGRKCKKLQSSIVCHCLLAVVLHPNRAGFAMPNARWMRIIIDALNASHVDERDCLRSAEQ